MIDFKKISQQTDHYNFHSHTQFCDGRATMDEFARAAVASGMLHYGFTPHSPVPVESPCNMSFESVPAYFAEANRIKQEYTGQTTFYTGMEIDYLGESWGPSDPYFDTLDLDYRIGSVHFIPSPDGMIDVDGSPESFLRKMERHFDNDIEHVVRTFYRQTLGMIDAGGFDIIGHYDKIGFNASQFRPGIESEEWYVRLLDEVTEAIITAGVVVEINTKARKERGRFFPDPRTWRRLTDAGVTVIVDSDAHWPELIDASRTEALGMLRR